MKPLSMTLAVPIFHRLFAHTASIGDLAVLKVHKGGPLELSLVDGAHTNAFYIRIEPAAVKEMDFPSDVPDGAMDIYLDLVKLRNFADGAADIEATDPVLMTVHDGRIRLKCGRLALETGLLGERPVFYNPPPDDKLLTKWRVKLSAKMLKELAVLAKTLGMGKQKSYDLRFVVNDGNLTIVGRDTTDKASVLVGAVEVLGEARTGRTMMMAETFLEMVKAFGNEDLEMRMGNDVPLLLRHVGPEHRMDVLMAPRIDDENTLEDDL